LINTLRQAAGISDEWKDSSTTAGTENAPAWMKDRVVTKTLDAQPIIAGGGHPMEQVLSELRDLQAGEVYLLLTPFLPAPLLDIVRKQGYQVWSKVNDQGLYENYVRKED
jgi:hypothetical protein